MKVGRRAPATPASTLPKLASRGRAAPPQGLFGCNQGSSPASLDHRMKLTVAFRRRLAWAHAPATLLVALLQRTPLLRVAFTAEEGIIASPISGVLRSAVAGAASLGALH